MEDIKKKLLTHHDIFALDEYDFGRTELIEHKVCTGTHPPICQLARREAFALRPIIQKMIQDMLKHGILDHLIVFGLARSCWWKMA